MTYSEHSEKSEEELAAAVYVNDKLKCLIVSLLQGALSGLLNTLKVWNLMVFDFIQCCQYERVF